MGAFAFMDGFYITVSNGLLKDGHRERMGPAIWEFLWCIDAITEIDDKGIGWVLGGSVITLDRIVKECSGTRRTVQRNLAILKSQGYIAVYIKMRGIVIGVNKAKKQSGRVAKNGAPYKSDVPHMAHHDTKSGAPIRRGQRDRDSITASLQKARGVSSKKRNMRQTDERAFSDDGLPSLDSETGLPVLAAPKKGIGASMNELLKWAALRRGGAFQNPIKQYSAMKRMRIAGITPDSIRSRWAEMENDSFYQEKGFDFTTVANSFDRKR